MSDQLQRAFTTEFKVLIVRRIEGGERLSAVAVELGIRRKLLYEWRAAYRALGAAGLNRKRGPKPGGNKPGGKRFSASPRGRPSAAAPPSSGVASSSAQPRGEAVEADALALAQARIAELERVIGRQQADLHFFREALRLWDATSQNGGAPISTKSSRK